VEQNTQTTAAGASVDDAAHAGLLGDLLGRIASCFARRETRMTCRDMVHSLLAELDDHNCWTIAEAAGHPGPYRMQHLLSRARCDDQGILDGAADWATGRLTGEQGANGGDAVLIVDETGDAKSSADCVGAARQYSGTLGGIALCQVAVTLTYAAPAGHALIGRALYLPGEWAADEERRELAGVPDDVMFATKPQLADGLLQHAHDLGIRAAFVAGDEVYGGLDLRKSIRERGTGYVMAVRSNYLVTLPSGRSLTVKNAAKLAGPAAWQRMRAGSATKGAKDYHWAMIEVRPDDTPEGHDDGHAVLLLRRHRYTGTVSYFLCWTGHPVPLARLIAVAVTRWKIEMVFTQLAKRAVRPVRGCGEHVADLDLVAGNDHAVDEQLGQLPPLLEGGGGEPGADGLAECLDAVGDGLQFQPLSGGGVQLALLGRQGGAAAVQLVPLALEFGQGDDLGQVGVEQPLLLAVQLAQGLADGRLPGVEFLGQPGAALRPV
jgi:SRSO17 transposase